MDEAMVVAPSPDPTPPQNGHKESTAPALRPSLCLGALLTQAPNWSGPLVCDHLTSQDRLALFSTCRGASRTLLTTADHASMQLHVNEATSMEHLHAIKAAMQMRGKRRHTHLGLTAQDDQLLLSTLGSIRGVASWLNGLTVDVLQPVPPGPAAVVYMATALNTVAFCCPKLKALHVRPVCWALPTPRCFPKLEELTVQLPQDSNARHGIVCVLGMYVNQLTHLTITGCLLPPTLRPVLLSPTNIGPRLHTFQLPLQRPPGHMDAASEEVFSVRLGDLITEASNWSCTLVTDCLDPQARLALFHTCKGSRCMVVETAERATLRLWVNLRHLMPRRLGGLLATISALQARGNQPLKLHLSTTTIPMMAVTLGLMGQLEWLQELIFDVGTDREGEGLPAPILANVARCCPNLRVLNILATPVRELPGPELFPKLEQLTVPPAAGDSIVRSLAPYLKQLIELSLGNLPRRLSYGPDGPQMCKVPFLPYALLPLLLRPDSIGAQLRTLRLPAELDDALLGLLLGCAPTLEELQVRGISLETRTYSRTPVSWQRLRCDGLPNNLKRFTHLPLAPAMEIFCTSAPNSWTTFTCDITDAAVLAGRYKAVRFITPGDRPGALCFQLEQGGTIHHEDAPFALRAGLALLSCFTMPANVSPQVLLSGQWRMSTELMLELRGLPAWARVFQVGEVKWLRQPLQYAQLLRLLPDSYAEVHIIITGGIWPTTPVLESICLGAPQNRTAATPLRVVLVDLEQEVLQAIQGKMERGAYPHVIVE